MSGKIVSYILIVLLCSVSISSGADKKTGGDQVTQLGFVAKLVDYFGWSEGLPEKPTEKDYLAILKGNRSLLFEAEDVYDQRTDSVSVRNYNLFGPFTGRGWVHGTNVQTAVHFTVFIPIAGKYTVKAATKGDNQLWSIAGRAFKVSATAAMKEVVVGQLFVPAGRLEFNAVIPPDGGIDSIRFTAPSLAPIEPVSGWNFPAPFTKGQFAEFRAALIGNENLLPDDRNYTKRSISPSTFNVLPPGIQVTDSAVLGKPLSPKWLRGGAAPVTIEIPFDADDTAVYNVRARCTGSTLTTGFGPRTISTEGKPYLEWLDLGNFRLAKAHHTLQLHLPPFGGVDTVEISRKASGVSEYFALSGLTGSPGDILLLSEVDALLKSLQDVSPDRK